MAVVIIDDTHGRWRGLGGEVRMNGSSIPVPFLHYGQESVASNDGGGTIGDMQGRWGGGEKMARTEQGKHKQRRRQQNWKKGIN